MKRALLLFVVACTVRAFGVESFGVYQHGTVVRMRMGACGPVQHSFMFAMSGPQSAPDEGNCPEYTLVSDKVVFVILGRSSAQIIPLADVIEFRLHNSELAVRLDDEKHESKFAIKEMVLRSQWELMQKHMEHMLDEPTPSVDPTTQRSRD
ncbi:MAG TPA: hypothetical protein VF753_17090 [Terriglobales bacterium]